MESRTNDGLMEDDTSVLLRATMLWTYAFLIGE
jgi:hypothetical protein